MAVSTVGIVGARGCWRRVTIAIVALVTLVVNLAQTVETAHAAELPPGMRTLSIPIPADVDRNQLQGLVDDINSRPGLLTDTAHEWSNLYGMVLPGAPFSVEMDFDGVFALSGSNLTLTIEAPEAQAQDLSWWADALVYGATLVLQIVIRSLCVGVFAAASGGTATLPAIVLCAGAAGFFQQLIYQAIVISQTTEPDPGAWGNALLKSLMSALQGVLWEGAISKFSKELLPKVLGKAGQWLFEQGKAFVQYWEAVGAGMQRLGSRLVSGTPAFIEGFLAAWRAVGSPTVNLRVLPLGDSITYGVGTSDNSSYRAHLSSLLRAGDVDGLDYVGAQRNGTLADKDHEGHPGWTISQINAIAPCTIREHRPNVVTLHIGTNDMARNVAVDTAPDRLRSLIRRITDQAPETSVVVATLIPSTVPTTMNRIQRYNEAIPGIVADFQRRGRPVFLADMGAVTPGDMTDSLHPNANGYRKMAEAFARTIDGRDDYLVVDAQGVTQGWLNAGTGNGVSWASQGVVASGVGASRDAVRFADVNGDGRDDYVVLDADGVAKGWLNTRSPSGMGWSYAGVVASGVGATPDQVRFADLDGDSRDDYLVVQPQGQVRAWLNTFGESGAGWLNQGQIADGVGASRANVEFADIDGGGNTDYLVVNGSGQVSAWVSDVYATSDRWDRLGVVASGVGATLAEVRFADLNGDRRADYLVVGPQGQVRAWLNDRANGSPWRYLGEVAAGAGPREEVRFADLTGDGRDDYLLLGAQGQVKLWVNVPGGPTGISWQSKGEVAAGSGPRDSIRFGDINGDGRDDYLVVGAQAQVTAWFNTPGGSGGVSWVAQGDIASGLGVTGSLIAFADIDGDRRDDYLVVNDQARIWAWRNNRGGGGATWITEGQIAAGVGATRDQLFLADLNGDLRDDYLVSSAAGVVTGWTNNGLIRKS